jgi:hypothetical protein
MLFPVTHSRTRRQKWLIVGAVVVGLALCGACIYGYERYYRGPDEEMLYGTWQFSSIDATGRMLFRADHTYSTMFPFEDLRDWKVVTKGTWRVEGRYLVVAEENMFRRAGDSTPPIRHSRVPIRFIADDTFDLDRVLMKRIQ